MTARFRRWVLLSVMGLATAIAPVAAAPPEDVRPRDDAQDVLILSPLQPIRLTLHVQLDGAAFRSVRRETIDRLFKHYDSDRNGALSADQAASFLALFRGRPPAGDAAAPVKMDMKRPDVTRAEILAWLDQSAPAFVIQTRLASRGAGPALLPLLDTDGDRRLSREELADACRTLHLRDFNEDELLSEQELIAGPSLSSPDDPEGLAAAEGPVVVLDAARSRRLANLLLSRYDRDRDGRLSCAQPLEIQLLDEAVSVLDQDRDGTLDREELGRFLELPADAQLHFALGNRARRQSGSTAAPEYRLRHKLDGGYKLHIGHNSVDFRRSNRNPARAADLPRLRNYDGNGDGSLDADEAANIPNLISFAAADADGDGKLVETEFDAHVERVALASAIQITLDVSDEGQDLFTKLDRNFDRLLTPRELYFSTDVLSQEDADADGYLSSAEVPYNMVLELSRGERPPATVVSARRTAEPRLAAQSVGPVWFQKLDRNRDGDVSLREFLGPQSAFRSLDTSGDELIDADEAAAAQVGIQ